MTNEVASDESTSSCNQYFHSFLILSNSRLARPCQRSAQNSKSEYLASLFRISGFEVEVLVIHLFSPNHKGLPSHAVADGTHRARHDDIPPLEC